MIAITPLPEVITPEALDTRIAQLHAGERVARRALGTALILGLPGEAARAELRRIREDLDATYSAQRLLELASDVP